MMQNLQMKFIVVEGFPYFLCNPPSSVSFTITPFTQHNNKITEREGVTSSRMLQPHPQTIEQPLHPSTHLLRRILSSPTPRITRATKVDWTLSITIHQIPSRRNTVNIMGALIELELLLFLPHSCLDWSERGVWREDPKRFTQEWTVTDEPHPLTHSHPGPLRRLSLLDNLRTDDVRFLLSHSPACWSDGVMRKNLSDFLSLEQRVSVRVSRAKGKGAGLSQVLCVSLYMFT